MGEYRFQGQTGGESLPGAGLGLMKMRRLHRDAAGAFLYIQLVIICDNINCAINWRVAGFA
jgi:hypothetical protein